MKPICDEKCNRAGLWLVEFDDCRTLFLPTRVSFRKVFFFAGRVAVLEFRCFSSIQKCVWLCHTRTPETKKNRAPYELSLFESFLSFTKCCVINMLILRSDSPKRISCALDSRSETWKIYFFLIYIIKTLSDPVSHTNAVKSRFLFIVWPLNDHLCLRLLHRRFRLHILEILSAAWRGEKLRQMGQSRLPHRSKQPRTKLKNIFSESYRPRMSEVFFFVIKIVTEPPLIAVEFVTSLSNKNKHPIAN